MENLRKKYREYTQGEDFKLNPNRELVDKVIEGLKRNKNTHGEYYCPCRRITGDTEKDQRKICPCRYHKRELEEQGHCHCMLFVKKKSS